MQCYFLEHNIKSVYLEESREKNYAGWEVAFEMGRD